VAAEPALAGEAVPFVEWGAFLPEFITAWPENAHAEHVSIVGPTGQGKTTLALAMLEARAKARGSAVVVLATKPRDATLRALGWPVVKEWPPGYGKEQVIFWPPYGDVRTVHQRQARAFAPMLADVFSDGRWVVYFDEASYFATELGLKTVMRRYWQQGRSQRLIVVAGTQRPVDVPRPMWSECSWLVAFRTGDDEELRRVGQIGGTSSKVILEAMRALRPHEFLVCETRTGKMVRSMMPKPKGARR